MYSQNNEEKFILEHFKTVKGKFLDIGCYDGMCMSNTWALVELGWAGLEVDASPVIFAQLMKNIKHSGRQGIELLLAAITVDGGIINFFDSGGDAISTSSTAHRDKWSKNATIEWQSIHMPSITPSALLKGFGMDFSLIDIDVEGYSYELFLEFPWEQLTKCSCIIVEHDRKIKEIENILVSLDYTTSYVSSENIVLTRELR